VQRVSKARCLVKRIASTRSKGRASEHFAPANARM
jgi:hypothetical protein